MMNNKKRILLLLVILVFCSLIRLSFSRLNVSTSHTFTVTIPEYMKLDILDINSISDNNYSITLSNSNDYDITFVCIDYNDVLNIFCDKNVIDGNSTLELNIEIDTSDTVLINRLSKKNDNYVSNILVKPVIPYIDNTDGYEYSTIINDLIIMPSSITVSFDTRSDTVINDMVLEKGSIPSRPSSPLKSGYLFDKWLLDGNVYNFDVGITSNKTLVARYLEDKFEDIVDVYLDGVSIIQGKEINTFFKDLGAYLFSNETYGLSASYSIKNILVYDANKSEILATYVKSNIESDNGNIYERLEDFVYQRENENINGNLYFVVEVE